MDKKEVSVLVVEDNSSDIRLLHENIREFKTMYCRTTNASNMKDVEKMLDMEDFDAIFLDLNLPDSSGLDTVKRINDRRRNAPIIIMSGTSDQKVILKTLEMGVQNYIVKGSETPVSLENALLYSMEREKNMAAVRSAESKFSGVFNSNPVGMLITRLRDGKIIECNAVLEQELGFTRGEIIGRTTIELGLWPGREQREEIFGKITAGTPIAGVEVSLRSKKGELIPYLYSAALLDLNCEKCVISTMVDISQQRKAEAGLLESEERFRTAFEQAAVGMTFTSIEGKFIDANRRFCEITGYTKEELVKMKFAEIADPDEVEKAVRSIKDMIEGRLNIYTAEHRDIRKDGSRIWVNLSVSLVRNPDNSPKYFMAVYEDISARKKTEKEEHFFIEVQSLLSQPGSLEDKYRFIAEKIKEFVGQGVILVMALDEQKQVLKVASHSGLGKDLEKIIQMLQVDPTKRTYKLADIGKSEFKRFSSIKLELLKEGLYTLAAGTIPKQVCGVIQKMLNINYVYTIGFVADGSYFGGVAVMTQADMTQYAVVIERAVSYAANTIKRKIAEEKLKTSEEKWVAFTDSVDENMMLWDSDLNLVAANSMAVKVYVEMTGSELEPGKNILELMKNLKNTGRYEKYREVQRTGNPFLLEEYPVQHMDGEIRYYSLKAFKVGSGMGLITTDITNVKRSETILRQSFEKLREVDRMKSNFISIVSHELRTPLTIIKGFTSFLKKSVAGPLNDMQKDYVNTIDLNTVRLARIVNDMMDISKIESGNFPIEKERRELVGVINESVDGMHHIAHEKGISLETIIENKSAPAEIDRGRIIQAVSNLINNAMRFSKSGSTVKVGLKNAVDADIPLWAAEKMSEEKNYYYIYVADTGEGIEKKHLEKIFERFYQVENPNVRKHQGAGLGLSIAKIVAEAHDGFIWAESGGMGKGAKICMVIPE